MSFGKYLNANVMIEQHRMLKVMMAVIYKYEIPVFIFMLRVIFGS